MTQDRNEQASPALSRIGLAVLGAAAAGVGLAVASELLGRDAERQVPADGHFLDVEGARLHFVDSGSGRPIVMVHGLAGQLRNFTHSLTAMLEGEHRLIAVDRPRYGYSTAKPGTEPNLRDQGRLLARFIDKLGLEKPLVVGHSMGGAVALAAALHAPKKIGGLVLLAPLTQVLDQAPEALRLLQRDSRAARAAMARLFGVPVGRLGRRVNEAAIFAPDPAPEDFGTRGGGLLALRPHTLDAAMYEVGVSKDDLEAIVPRYGELKLPVSILFAREDNLLDPDLHGRRTAREIPGAVFEEIEGGHMLPVTHPEACARVIRATYARVKR
ncbi:alpha/beta fold hydrolase [Sphingomonas lenta]|uniref:Alpha/beta hydrolase n=1 Tax=Sphingomonas lenta TaxID=1141887 RepID=A0A2A2SH29_9SPHN|nr:alpha/beta hydrolase [Sphingomonas lenta]PAX08556.1 alpha/beta hydrolase [Sphingomonas lenta]